MKRLLIDARNLRCPLPLLKLKQGLAQISTGDEVEIVSTDAGSWRDIPSFIAMTSHELVEQNQQSEDFQFVVRKGD